MMRSFHWLNSQKNHKQMKVVIGVGLLATGILAIFGILDQALITLVLTIVFILLLKKEQEKTANQ